MRRPKYPKKTKSKYPEYELQKSICTYLDLQHKEVLYMSDTIASVKLTIPQQVRNKAIQKEGFKCPDLLIFEPRGGYAGLYIELKVKSPFKLDGDLYKNDHLEGQAKSIQDLKDRGYRTCFSWGFDKTIKIINDYLKLPKNGNQI